MDKVTNQEQIEEIINVIEFIQNETTKSTVQIKNYIHFLNTEMIEFDMFLKQSKELESENETVSLSDKIENAQQLLTKITDIIDYKTTILESNKKIIEMTTKLNQIVEIVNKTISENETVIHEANNIIITQIMKWKEQIFLKQIEPYQQMINQLKKGFDYEQDEYKKKLQPIEQKPIQSIQQTQPTQPTQTISQNRNQIPIQNTHQNTNQIPNQRIVQQPSRIDPVYLDETLQQTNGMITTAERQLLQQWTHKSLGTILFDSTIHRWSINNSEFTQRILNHRQLLFLIKDTRDNLFGCYISSIILPRMHIWREDSGKFLFSLRSNGRLQTPMKFESISTRNAYWLQQDNDKFLIALCNCGIYLMKNNVKNESYCNQTNGSKVISYQGIENALTGSVQFNPQHIVVIEMV